MAYTTTKEYITSFDVFAKKYSKREISEGIDAVNRDYEFRGTRHIIEADYSYPVSFHEKKIYDGAWEAWCAARKLCEKHPGHHAVLYTETKTKKSGKTKEKLYWCVAVITKKTDIERWAPRC